MGRSFIAKGAVVAALATVVALMVPAALADTPGSDRKCAEDTSLSVSVCLTMSYQQGTAGGLETIALTNFHYVLTRHDPTVSVTSVVVHAGISGKDSEGNIYPADSGQHTWTSPSIGATHTYEPWWASPNRRLELAGAQGFYQAGNIYVTLKRGGTTWTFHTDDIVEGTLLTGSF